MKEYKKLYKAGKMWVTATLFALALGGGMFVATQANADSLGNEPTQAVVTTSTQSNGSQTPIATTGNATTQVKYAATNGQVDYNSNYGNLDSVQLKQAANGTVSGNLVGWHAAGASAVQPYHYVLVYDRTDNREITRIHPDSIQRVTRNDVQNVYPNVYNSRNSGFETSFQIPTYTLRHSLSVISRYSNDPNFGEGNRTDYWFNVNLNMGNYANLDKVAVNGNQLHVALDGTRPTRRPSDKDETIITLLPLTVRLAGKSLVRRLMEAHVQTLLVSTPEFSTPVIPALMLTLI